MKHFIKGTNEIMKEVNVINLLRLIRKYGPISTSKLSRITELTPVTVLKLIKDLLAAGYIVKKGFGKSKGGRKPKLVDFNPDNKNIIAVNIDLEKINIALTNLGAEIIDRTEKKINVENGLRTIINELKDLIHEFSDNIDMSGILGIGISFPGPIDPEKNKILFSPHIPDSENYYLQQEIQEEFDILTKVENDSNAAALAEKLFGKGTDIKNLVYISVDRGIGSGIIIDGHIYHGKGNAGEIGHMVIDIDGPRCDCGNFGCLEAISSGLTLIKRVKKDLKLGVDTVLTDINLKDICLEDILKAARNGDDYAKKLLDDSALYMGVGFCNLINMFNPDLFIIGGRIALNYPDYNQVIKKVERKRLNRIIEEDVKIEVSTFKKDSYLIGASSLLVYELLKLPTNSKTEEVSVF